jgi:hypothetical protein
LLRGATSPQNSAVDGEKSTGDSEFAANPRDSVRRRINRRAKCFPTLALIHR